MKNTKELAALCLRYAGTGLLTIGFLLGMFGGAWEGHVPAEELQAMRIIALAILALGTLCRGAAWFLCRETSAGKAASSEDAWRRADLPRGRITGIMEDAGIRVNGRHPVRLIVSAQHPGTGETLTLQSERVWESEFHVGDWVDVRFDMHDAAKSMVILEEENK